MATPYPGDPNANQPPSISPTPFGTPTVLLPADSDPPNGATFAQAFKVLADFIAWLMAPFGTIGIWAQKTWTVRNARLQTRFTIDHRGFLSAKNVQWKEDWGDVTLLSTVKTANGSGAYGGRWFYSRTGDTGGAEIFAQEAGSVGGGGAAADSRTSNMLLASNFGGSFAVADSEVETCANTIVDDDLDLVMQWDAQASLENSDTTRESAMGLITGSLLGSGGTFAGSAQFGAAFLLFTGSINWHFYSKATGAGAATIVDTGLSSVGRHRFRIEYQGANVADDGTNRLLAFLDDNLVVNTPGFTLAAAGPDTPTRIRSFFRHRATNSHTWLMVMITDFFANYWAGDVE